MSSKISIRNAANAKIGLLRMIKYVTANSPVMEMVELGCYVGDSTEIFAQHVGLIHAVDPWVNGYDDNDAASHQHPMEKIEAQFDQMVNIYPNIMKHKMTSDTALALFDDQSLDLVYIDALHTYEGARDDIARYRPKVATGGWLCGHDYQPRFAGVIKAVDEAGGPEKVFKDTSWVMRVKQ